MAVTKSGKIQAGIMVDARLWRMFRDECDRRRLTASWEIEEFVRNWLRHNSSFEGSENGKQLELFNKKNEKNT